MRRSNGLSFVAVAGMLGALACSDANDAGTGPNFAPAPPPTGLVCDFGVMKSSAGAYLGRPNAADALITTMKKQYGSGLLPLATATGFDILGIVANAHTAVAAAGTAVQGSKLTNDVIGCMTLNPAVTQPIDFTGALGPNGAYQVRGANGDPNNTVNVVSQDRKTVIAPPAGGFYGWVDTEVLFYSSPIPNTFLTEAKVGVIGHRWNTVPERHAFSSNDGTIAMCVAATDRDRIQEVDADGAQVLTLAEITDFTTLGLTCPLTTTAAPTGLIGRLAHFAKSLVVPQAAYAGRLGGGTGGLLGGLSDFGVVDVARVDLAFSTIGDSRTMDPIPTFTVTATAAGGSPLPGVSVTVAVAGNEGGWIFSGNLTQITNAEGVATFPGLNLDKPGGYILSATSSYTGFPTATVVTSNMFWIKQ